jgi:hypothetical protein
LEATRAQVVFCWLGIGLNVGCVALSARWLWAHAAQVHPSWFLVGIAGAIGLLLADLYSGLIHWGTDTWFDELQIERVVSIAREHHLYPSNIVDYGLADYAGYTSWPSVVVFGPALALLTSIFSPSRAILVAVLICGQVSGFMLFGTHFHRLGHARPGNWLIRFLQSAHFLITPQYHARHHRENHDTHYCVVNGWMNPICDAIGFWRGLENVVHALTGAVPRRNDHEWFARFRKDRSFMSHPVPSLLELRRGQ